jgi:hypothetical protein
MILKINGLQSDFFEKFLDLRHVERDRGEFVLKQCAPRSPGLDARLMRTQGRGWEKSGPGTIRMVCGRTCRRIAEVSLVVNYYVSIRNDIRGSVGGEWLVAKLL